MTGDQILERLNELFGDKVYNFAYEEYGEIEGAPYDDYLSTEENDKNLENFMGLGKIERVSQKGGSDQGSSWSCVTYFEDHDVYIQTVGYYQSYSGTDFHDGIGRVVSPKKKTITVFE